MGRRFESCRAHHYFMRQTIIKNIATGISKKCDILSKNDKLLGCGIIAYDSDEIEIISGKKSTEIKKVLGYKGRDEAIHRNDMVIK